MIRIRKITNPCLESNLRQVEKVKSIIRLQFPSISESKINLLIDQMRDPLSCKFQTMLFIAESINETVRGFALLLYMSDLGFCYLDYLAVSPERISSGLGGALYQRVRDEAESLDGWGVFFECLPDDPALCRDRRFMDQNRKRLAFYERFGARPITGTLYETPVKPEDDSPPYLVFDGLGKRDTLPNDHARLIVRAILERKYGTYCPVSYIDRVIDSIREDPVRLRPPQYTRNRELDSFRAGFSTKPKIFLVVNDQHRIHHVKERGYVESPVRVSLIQKELNKTGFFYYKKVAEYPERFILDVHHSNYYQYFKKVCRDLAPGKSIYPYVFPLRNAARAPKEWSVRAGYYCFDTFTPLNRNAYLAARWGVNCTLTAADAIIEGYPMAYVLTRPPGHHAEESMFGGFCYFNNCAIAAQYLSPFGRIAILDIDYHHGNGQQQIFYHRNDILTISIHGHPSFAYPYFSGFVEEKGEGVGIGYNLNFPLPETLDFNQYRTTLAKALKKIEDFHPEFLIVALGFDTAKGDPTGTWNFSFKEFHSIGRSIGQLPIPLLIIQEGGYRHQSLGINARAFFTGLFETHLHL
ncbi:MAG: histone deacetylase family protein [Candidatus Delongbacteria bacterium]|nr:histone deacetylase family protein [Candidatus Delongbacteria bacterium]